MTTLMMMMMVNHWTHYVFLKMSSYVVYIIYTGNVCCFWTFTIFDETCFIFLFLFLFCKEGWVRKSFCSSVHYHSESIQKRCYHIKYISWNGDVLPYTLICFYSVIMSDIPKMVVSPVPGNESMLYVYSVPNLMMALAWGKDAEA